MDLLVIRHGIAETRESFALTGAPDERRPLTTEGSRKMIDAARGLHQLVAQLDGIASSPLTRARETAAVVAEEYGAHDLETTDALAPDAPLQEFVSWALGRADRRTVAVIGHEPHLGTLVSWLVSGHTAPLLTLTKGGACLVRLGGAVERAGGTLRWLLTAQQLRRIASAR